MSPAALVALSFSISAAASLGLVATYFLGGQAQVEGVLLGVSLGGLGLGLVLWATDILGGPEMVEERSKWLPAEDGPLPELRIEPSDQLRRRLLVGLLAAAGGILAGALAIPALSLGPRPRRSLFETPWADGLRVVSESGRALRPEDLDFQSVTTVFPEGRVGSADAQTLLLRVDPSLLRLSPVRAQWTVQGCVAYSKICTHAGCPVGLYRAAAHELLCPCHQSTFDVLRGAEPVFGPAARPLPQLPLALDDSGFLIARGDFPEPVGPSFWNMREDRP